MLKAISGRKFNNSRDYHDIAAAFKEIVEIVFSQHPVSHEIKSANLEEK